MNEVESHGGRSAKMRLDRLLLALISAIFVIHAAAVALAWYVLYPWIDIPMHIAGGFWIGLLFFYLFFERRNILPCNLSFAVVLFLAGGFVALIGTGWEVYEYLSNIFISRTIPFGGSIPGIHFDTLKDLFDDLLGGIMAVAVWHCWFRSKKAV